MLSMMCFQLAVSGNHNFMAVEEAGSQQLGCDHAQQQASKNRQLAAFEGYTNEERILMIENKEDSCS